MDSPSFVCRHRGASSIENSKPSRLGLRSHRAVERPRRCIMGWMKFAACGGGQLSGFNWGARWGGNNDPVGVNLSGPAHARGRAGFILRYTNENGQKYSYRSPFGFARGTSSRLARLRSDAFRVDDADVWASLTSRGFSVWFKVLADGGGGVAQFHVEVRSQDRSGNLGRFSNRNIRVGTWNNSRDSSNWGLIGYVDVVTPVFYTLDDVWDGAYEDHSRTTVLGSGWPVAFRTSPPGY